MEQDTGKFRKNTKDQYYTKESTAKSCLDIIYANIPNHETYQWIEPSAGNGVFLHLLPSTFDRFGIDLEPKSADIQQGNFLDWTPTNEKRRIFFGNPPFGRQGSLAKSFIKHASHYANIIAFILPRSFVKPSMSRAFPLEFHCIHSQELGKNAFEVNKVEYDVPCVFQIWEKKTAKRTLSKPIKEEGFTYVKHGQPFHIAFKRVGGLAGKCYQAESTDFNRQYHYFLKLEEQYIPHVKTIIDKVNLHTFPSNTVGPRSLSKSEANEVLNTILASIPKPDQTAKTGKKMKGQFYTVNSSYILDGLPMPDKTARRIIEPFAGKGDLLDWLAKKGNKLPIESYDIDPKKEGVVQRDTLLNPPTYKDSWILTNPPYLARNKCQTKEIFDKYDTNDLYKCFIQSLTRQDACAGGIFIIPAGFFLSPRDLDLRCRNDFLTKYRLLKVKYFEETVFPDTTTTVVAFAFEKSPTLLEEQTVEWISMPSGNKRTFRMSKENNWIIGGEIYNLPVAAGIKIRRHVEGQKLKDGEQMTSMTLSALDSGTKDGRICLEYKEGYAYPAKECSRTYATLCVQGRKLSAEEQKKICLEFNALIEKKRSETWSLFLPQFRESKEYARKRIPFELAYTIVQHLMITC